MDVGFWDLGSGRPRGFHCAGAEGGGCVGKVFEREAKVQEEDAKRWGQEAALMEKRQKSAKAELSQQVRERARASERKRKGETEGREAQGRERARAVDLRLQCCRR